jgi:hypothetical protein
MFFQKVNENRCGLLRPMAFPWHESAVHSQRTLSWREKESLWGSLPTPKLQLKARKSYPENLRQRIALPAGETRADRAHRQEAPRYGTPCGVHFQVSVGMPACPLMSCVNLEHVRSVRLSFLICRMGILTAPISLGSYED